METGSSRKVRPHRAGGVPGKVGERRSSDSFFSGPSQRQHEPESEASGLSGGEEEDDDDDDEERVKGEVEEEEDDGDDEDYQPYVPLKQRKQELVTWERLP